MTLTKYPPIVHVDQIGKPIGPIDYQSAHPKDRNTQGIRHATVNCLLFKDDTLEEVLLTFRGVKVAAPGKWDVSAGGHLDWLINENRAEDPYHCMVREIGEELFAGSNLPKGLNIGRIGHYTRDTPANNPEFVHLYKGIFRGPFNPNIHEVADIRFVNVGALLKKEASDFNVYTRTLTYCLRCFFKGKDKF